MSVEVVPRQSSSASPRDFGSLDCYSSSEASSRLAARLERSEYKRSRGKQRLQNNYGSRRSHGRNRDRENSSTRKDGRRKAIAPSLPTTDDKNYSHSAEDGVTSIWEVHVQRPHFYNEESFSHQRQHENYTGHVSHGSGSRKTNQDRPHSIHEIPLDPRNVGLQLRRLPGKLESKVTAHPERILTGGDRNYREPGYEERTKSPKNPIRDLHTQTQKTYPNRATTKPYTSHTHSMTVEEPDHKTGTGHFLSQSLSSSFSSHVGSSDEKEYHQGIYSAYDVAGRSPYGSSLNRRYSQSSHSSSSASWHQSNMYNVIELPSLLDSTPERPKSANYTGSQHDQYKNFKILDFNQIHEIPPAIPPKPTQFSSSYTIRLNLGATKGYFDHEEKVVPVIDFTKEQTPTLIPGKHSEGSRPDGNHGPSVREIAKRFSAHVMHISSECHSKTHVQDDTRRVKAESWPKVVSIMPQEISSFKEENKVLEIPPVRPPYPPEMNLSPRVSVVQVRKDEHHKSEDLASHRLSLQELIKLHEDQIALQTKSAQATAHAQIYLRRSASDVGPGGRPRVDFIQNAPEIQQYEREEDFSNTQGGVAGDYSLVDSTLGIAPNSNKPLVSDEQARYEVCKMTSSQSSPFKVIELTDKTAENAASDCTRERTPRVKRHRTIGIVGFRHQIDRTLGEKTENKQKRHTAIGIMNMYIDAIAIKQENSSREIVKEDVVVECHAIHTETIIPGKDNVSSEERKETERVPTKVFDIEEHPQTQDQAQVERSCDFEEQLQDDFVGSKVVEQPLVSANSQECYSTEPNIDLSDELKKEDRPLKSILPPLYKSRQMTGGLSRELGKEIGSQSASVTSTPSRQTQSPVVELNTKAKDGVTAHYKAMGSTARIGGSRAQYHLISTKPLPSNIHSKTKPFPTVKNVPVAQVSPVSPQHLIDTKTIIPVTPTPSMPPEPPTAQEMYETRLALWNLIPRRESSRAAMIDNQVHEGHLPVEERKKLNLLPRGSKTKLFEGISGGKQEIGNGSKGVLMTMKNIDPQTEEYYLSIIERLTRENQALKEKSESEKREFRQMYEEQKKVANAYQKLEDRYRRRVHELQDALAGCTCQGTLMVYKKSLKSSPARSNNDSDKSKTLSTTGLHILDELEEWLSEQSKTTKANNVSRDSLISSSSDLTGTGWDDHYYDMMGAIDQLNGTHV